MSPSEEPFKDYFEILEISPFASPAVLRAAYRTLAKIYHPDAISGANSSFDKKMTDINEAYEILSDPLKRADYWQTFVTALSKEADTKTLYFFKKWENILRKEDQKSHGEGEIVSQGIKLSDLLAEFFSNRKTQRHLFFQKLSTISPSLQEEVIKEILHSSHLTGDKEQEIWFWVLKEQKYFEDLDLGRAFRYKDLYMLLLQYIERFQISGYWDKIFLITKQLNIELESHIDIATAVLTMNLPQDFALLLRDFGKKEWKSLPFFKKKSKPLTYQKKYQAFQKAFKKFLEDQSGKNKQNSN